MHTYISNNSRLDVFILSIVRASICYLPPFLVEKADKTIVITSIHNTNSMMFTFVFHGLIDPIACLFYTR